MKLIAVTSGKGGTGKSCVTAFTGVALSEAGKKTLLVEQGMTAKSLDIIAAAQERAVFDISDVLSGRCTPEKAIVPASYTDNLYLLPGGAGPYHTQESVGVAPLLKELNRDYDFVLVDGVDFFTVAPKMFDTILMVTTPDTLSARACQNHARVLYESGADNLRLVINSVPAQVQPIYGAEDFDDLINLIGVQLIAVIPESPKLRYSANNAKMLDESSITIQVFDNLAARLRGQPRPLLIR